MTTCIKCGKEIPDGELFCAECGLNPGAGAIAPGVRLRRRSRAGCKPRCGEQNRQNLPRSSPRNPLESSQQSRRRRKSARAGR